MKLVVSSRSTRSLTHTGWHHKLSVSSAYHGHFSSAIYLSASLLSAVWQVQRSRMTHTLERLDVYRFPIPKVQKFWRRNYIGYRRSLQKILLLYRPTATSNKSWRRHGVTDRMHRPRCDTNLQYCQAYTSYMYLLFSSVTSIKLLFSECVGEISTVIASGVICCIPVSCACRPSLWCSLAFLLMSICWILAFVVFVSRYFGTFSSSTLFRWTLLDNFYSP